MSRRRTDRHRNNRGALFPNADKHGEDSPDYKGSVRVDGREYRVAAWQRRSRRGTRFLSLALTAVPTRPCRTAAER